MMPAEGWRAWLGVPIRIGVVPMAEPAEVWHGWLMIVAAGVLLPLMLLITRYMKVLPGQDWPRVLDHPLWWRAHRLLGGLAAAGVAVGVVLGFIGVAAESHLLSAHAWIGWLAAGMLATLLVNGLLRGAEGGPGHHQRGTLVHLHDLPGDHYDMSRRRRWFERTHKLLGYGLMAVFGLAIFTGLWHVNGPRWTLLAISGWWILLLLLALRWEREGRAIDGYQAKWGPGMNHPGNRIPVLTWGSRRYTEAQFARLPWVRRRGGARAAPADGNREPAEARPAGAVDEGAAGARPDEVGRRAERRSDADRSTV